jgi:hypothetical protein
MEKDIYKNISDRRAAIDWRRVHISADDRSPVGMFEPTKPSILQRVLSVVLG